MPKTSPRIGTTGTTIWTSNGNINGFNGGIFNNLAGALFEVRDDAAFTYIQFVGAIPRFNNFGALRKTGGTNATTFFSTAFHNPGSVEVLSGRLDFNGSSGTNSGSVQLAAGTALQLLSGNYRWTTGAGFSGSGTNRLSGGELFVDGAVPVENFALNGGNLRGAGTFTIRSNFTWTGGNMLDPGITEIAVNATATVSGVFGKSFDQRTFNNAGTTIWSGSGNINVTSGATFNNLAGALFEARDDAAFTYIQFVGGIPTFNNSGTFRKTGGTGTTTFFSTIFTNSGVMELKKGTVNLSGSGFTQTATGTLATDIGGLTAGTDFGRLTMSGVATLAGTLNVNRVNAYEPNLNDAFAILSFGSRSGQFTTLNGLAIGNGKQFQANYSGTALTLNVVAGP